MKKLISKPFVGIIAFIVVLFSMPLGHALMAIINAFMGDAYKYHGAIFISLIGVALLIFSVRTKSELTQTFQGLFAGILLWTGFVEYSFIVYADHLGIDHLLVGGDIVTKAEYLVMPSSIGLLIAISVNYIFSPDTRCRLFIVMRKVMGLKIASNPQKERNYAVATSLEIIFILWTFYLMLLLVYDDALGGDRSAFTYTALFFSMILSGYLMWRLLQYKKMGAAIRYAIPTVIIFWNCLEIIARWEMVTEIWNHPMEYTLEILLILGAFIAVIFLVLYVPRWEKKKAEKLNTV